MHMKELNIQAELLFTTASVFVKMQPSGSPLNAWSLCDNVKYQKGE
jgi:hypothetical protein